jgi:hypothetical protein
MLDGPLPPKFRMTMPGRWDEGGLMNFAGRVRCRRRFGYPGRIDAHERVWLTFAGVAGNAEVCLNGVLLGRCDGAEGPFEFEISHLLQVRNELMVQVDALEGPGGLWGEVALEVRCTAFLRKVRAWLTGRDRDARLHVAGEVVGTAERPLELYVLFDGATVHYSTLLPVPDGLPFHLIADELSKEQGRPRAGQPDERHHVRIDLVNGATIWYAVEHVLGPEPGDAS